jgi:hypothetical protein
MAGQPALDQLTTSSAKLPGKVVAWLMHGFMSVASLRLQLVPPGSSRSRFMNRRKLPDWGRGRAR